MSASTYILVGNLAILALSLAAGMLSELEVIAGVVNTVLRVFFILLVLSILTAGIGAIFGLVEMFRRRDRYAGYIGMAGNLAYLGLFAGYFYVAWPALMGV